jgi:hypothetical protein
MKIYIVGLKNNKNVADYIATEYLRLKKPQINAIRFDFSRLLIITLCTLYDADENIFQDETLKNKKLINVGSQSFSPNELLQHYGDFIRQKHCDFFIDLLIKQIDIQIDGSFRLGDNEDIAFIISDVQFQNEVDFIKSRKGLYIENTSNIETQLNNFFR